MNTSTDKALLPAGLSDRLAPDAAIESDVRESLVKSFIARGFDRVQTPLVEFEDTLLAGPGAAMTAQTFRLMDPVSQRMMGLRADITPQAARIATTRLAHIARPLRLCYSGQVLRVRGTQLRPERQFTQAGAEIIGIDDPAADAEVVLTAVEALNDLGVKDIKVDLCQPMIGRHVMAALQISQDAETVLREALDRKDPAEVKVLTKEFGKDAQSLFVALLEATGSAKTAVNKIAALPLTGDAADARDTLLSMVELIQKAAPNLALTLDAAENRGFEYHCGVTFTIFAPGARGELGSGGRYMAGSSDDGATPEPATGFTLFLDSILSALPTPAQADLIYVPMGSSREDLAMLRDKGYRTRQGFDAGDKVVAKHQGCSHIFNNGTIEAL